jgi:hypothetical protein
MYMKEKPDSFVDRRLKSYPTEIGDDIQLFKLEKKSKRPSTDLYNISKC